MKNILGLDLGTSSIGWALVREAESPEEVSEIIKLGVRVNPLTTDEKKDFENGNPLTTNAYRTLKRGARRNLQRYKQRRENLKALLRTHGLITDESILTEVGKQTTHQTLALRAKAATERIELEELARVLLAINKKRGYKSSRKTVNTEEGQAIDGMQVAKILYDHDLTPGQYVFASLKRGGKYVPDFYRSDLQAEFDRVWHCQQKFYPEILDDTLYNALQGQGLQNSRKKFLAIKGIYTAENKGKRDEVKLQHYQWRSEAIEQKLSIEEVAYVLAEINNNINQSSGYLGAISDRSKELYFHQETVGQYQWRQISQNRHTSLKNQVFYRQDYLDEFERIWETQRKYHAQLTPEFKKECRDLIIFYQRKLKSQKALLGICQFECAEIAKRDDKGAIRLNPQTQEPLKMVVGRKVIPKSSPLFQVFKIWQGINNLTLKKAHSHEIFKPNEEDRLTLFNELNLRGKLSQNEVLKLLGLSNKEWKTNFENGLEGNRTNEALYNAFAAIAEIEGCSFDWSKKSAKEIKTDVQQLFAKCNIDSAILDFDPHAHNLEAQSAYRLWHLLYATEDDETINQADKLIYGNSAVALKKKLVEKFGFKPEHAKVLGNISFAQDYGSLSAKAIRKILPFLEAGNEYSEACRLAGYNHANSLTREENDQRELADKMSNLPKNSLRNPVVEKILNQMVNLTNEIIDRYGKPDEVRIELARELKKSAKERKEMTASINQQTRANEEYRKLIIKEFGIPNPTKNDIIRYRLYEELAPLGYKDVFTNQYIDRADLYSKKIDIEHIIPKALIFDDSFSNKTLAFRDVNIRKSDSTAYDFIQSTYSQDLEAYKARVKELYNDGKGTISRAKREKLLKAQKDLDMGFIERDLRNSQYIAREARNMLLKVFRKVVATSGSITDRLREDWGIVNVMKEINLPKYRALGLTEVEQRLNVGTGELIETEVIKDWTKRNDHRHHAMDALTVAFTQHGHIQYLNNLNARKDPTHQDYKLMMGLEKTLVHKKGDHEKKTFIPPMPNFRVEAKKHIEEILVSIKNKNKVVTKNINITKKSGGTHKKTELTPRGQLHKETVYGKSKMLMKTPLKLTKKTSLTQIELIAQPEIKALVKSHLSQYHNDPAVAFDNKTLRKTPILYRDKPLTEVLCYEEIFTIRTTITPDLKVDKVIDPKIRQILSDRLKAYGGNAKNAFSDLDQKPIWLNEAQGICIKSVTITAVSNAEPLHYKKDNQGNWLFDAEGNKIPTDFVQTSNNHHLALYIDKEGKLQDNIVSFFEATTRAQQGLPIVDKEYNKHLGWKFLFTLKQNEMVVFPNEDFDIDSIDLKDERNAKLISKHLYRVQTISKVGYGNSFVRDFVFRHHLETTVSSEKELKGTAYIQLKSLEHLRNLKKVRINHLGQIVAVGEY